MEYFLIYLFVMIERIGSLLSSGSVLVVIPCMFIGAVLFFSAMRAIDYDFNDVWENQHIAKFRKVAYTSLVIGLFMVTASKLIPSQKDLAIIVASGVTYEVITSDTGKRLGSKAIDLLEKKIDDALKDTPDVVKEAVVGKSL